MQDHEQAGIYRCGAFTVSPTSRRLYRDGERVDLEAKVFDLILLLLENREQPVAKLAVIARLWGQRPVTDAALSQLVYKARRAFDDDGDRQAVIRTVYGRGLQWVAPVTEEHVEPAEIPAVDAAHEADAPAEPTPAEPDAPEAPVVESAIPQPPRTRRHRAWIGLGVLALAGLLSIWIIPRSFAPPAPPPPRMAVLPMDNITGDTALDWTTRGLPGLIASLLGETPGLDVVDPLQAGRAWNIKPSQGRSHLQQVRYITHADVLVTGKLAKVADQLYQLTLHVDTGKPGDASDIVVTGSDPGAIALAAMPRLRRALALDPPAITSLADKPQDTYLAETFARGIDQAAHGDSQAALLHFALIAKSEPDFLPGRYQLARAQLRTNQQVQAQSTLRDLLTDALRQKQPAMAALALDEQAYLAQQRRAYVDALALLDRARPYAERANRPEIRTAIALGSTKAHASLDQLDDAERELQVARTLVADNSLHQLEPLLHNSAIFIADSRRDFTALEAAARAGLAANEALGNERGSMGAVLNIAYAMESLGRGNDALPLWHRVWRWGREHGDHQMMSLAGHSLTRQLSAAGLDDRATPINDELMTEGHRQDDRNLQSRALAFRAGIELDSDPAQALRTSREATALIDAGNDPGGMLQALLNEAYIAYIAEPAALAAIDRRAQAIAGSGTEPAHGFVRQEIRAMATAAAGDLAAARVALETAAGLARSAAETASLQQIAMHIALKADDAAIAAIGLHNADADRETSATHLRQIGEWAARRDDHATRDRAAARQETLRQAALNALADVAP